MGPVHPIETARDSDHAADMAYHLAIRLELEGTVDVWGLTQAALRRWYVFIPLVLASMAVAFAVASRDQAVYEAGGAVILVAPAQDPTTPNLYASSAAVQVLGLTAMSSAARASIVEDGLSEDYEISFTRQSPVMTIDVVADSPKVALSTAEGIVDFLETTLDRSQEELDIRKRNRSTLLIVDAPDTVNPVEGGARRVAAMLGGLGIVVALAMAVLLDAALARRKSRTLTSPTESIEPGLDSAAGRGATQHNPNDP